MGNQLSQYKAFERKSGSGSDDRKNEPAPFTYIAGRRFHGEKDVPYFLPNDIGEADR
jgi:hypothetical protein